MSEHVSFGIELEFLVACAIDQDEDVALRNILPKAMPELLSADNDLVHDEIRACLRKAGIPTCDGNEWYGGSLDEWTVKSDKLRENCDPHHYWAEVEVVSPPAYDFEEAFDMVRVVMHLITSNFKCRVNDDCGLHVHVGDGPDGINLRTSRNFMALYWAAEPLISTLHPEERTEGIWAMSSRRDGFCPINRQLTAEKAISDLGAAPPMEVMGEAPPGTMQDLDLVVGPVLKPVTKSTTDATGEERQSVEGKPFDRPMETITLRTSCSASGGLPDYGPPLLTNGHDSDDDTKTKANDPMDAADERRAAYQRLTEERTKPREHDYYTWHGVREFLSCDLAAWQVISLHGAGKGTSISAREDTDRRRLATLEFREARGSLDAGWVAAWAGVACGLVRFARDADPGRLAAVTGRCAEALARGDYDVVDLLLDIGVGDEVVRVCEERLARGGEAVYECLRLRHRGGDAAGRVKPWGRRYGFA